MSSVPIIQSFSKLQRYNSQENFIIDHFHKFYLDIVTLKRSVAGEGANLLRPLTEDGTAPQKRLVAAAISEHLCSELRQGALNAAQFGGSYAARAYNEAQFVMASLADEIFLHLVHWDGQVEWKDNLIEAKMFSTYSAGNLFFSKLDALLKRADPVDRDLAVIFLLALQLGFEGKFRESNEKKDIEDYKYKLFVFINGHEPQLAHTDGPIFSEAYQHTIKLDSDRNLPNAKKWVFGIIGIIFFYLIFSMLVWEHFSDPIFSAIKFGF